MESWLWQCLSFIWQSRYDHCVEYVLWSWYVLLAVCYRGAKAFDKAVETFERAADAYYKNHAYPCESELAIEYISQPVLVLFHWLKPTVYSTQESEFIIVWEGKVILY